MISTLTINPALDRLLFIDQLHKDSTNRIRRTQDVLGGKGTHVSINLSHLKIQSQAFGVTNGETGKRIQQLLNSYGNIDVKFIHDEMGNSRLNYALVESTRECTLITEHGRTVSEKTCNDLLELIESHTHEGDDFVLSGDASNTEIPFFYNKVMERLAKKNVRVFLDTSSENLIEGIKAQPFLVKPNLDELSQVTGSPIDTDEQIIEAIEQIAAKGVEVIAVSLGENGSIVKYGSQVYRVYPLTVDVANTIGCGDAYLSGLAYGFSQNLPFEEILRLACAVSAATAESELTVGFDFDRAMGLRSSVRLKRIE